MLYVLVYLALSYTEAAPQPDSGNKTICPYQLDPCGCQIRNSGYDFLDVDCTNLGLREVPDLSPLKETVVLPVHLNLQYNTISFVASSDLKGINLYVLDLHNNSLDSISTKAFTSFSNSLVELNVANNGLRDVPSYISGLTALRKLDFSGNLMSTNIPESNNPFDNLVNLEYLDLSGNTMTFIRNNRIFQNLRNLTYLRLADCNLEHFPAEILSYTRKLKHLILSHNSLQLYPSAISESVPDLKELDLRRNPITFDESKPLMQGLNGLEVLKLSSCEIYRITAELFRDIRNLKTLILADCNIEKIDSNAFEGFTNLKHLNISFNPISITEINLNAVSSTLEVLSLQGIHLKAVPKRLLEQLPNLHTTELNNNQITFLNEGDLGYIRRENHGIQLENNEIASIDPLFLLGTPQDLNPIINLENNLITNLSFLQTKTYPCDLEGVEIQLMGNNITCDCGVANLVTSKIVNLSGECGQPSEFQGLLLDAVHSSSMSDNKNLSSKYLEYAFQDECSTKSYTGMRYRCSCNSWVQEGFSASCESKTVNGATIIHQSMSCIFIIGLLLQFIFRPLGS